MTIPSNRFSIWHHEDRNRSRRRPGGFTLVELLVATTMILIAMSGMMLVYTQATAENAGAKQRQVADSLMTKTMEQVRALPFAKVASGLNDASGTDPAFSPAWTYNGETVPHSAALPPRPFYNGTATKHIQIVAVNKTTFTVAVYPSIVNPPTTPASYRVTVVVTWTAYGKIRTVSEQSLFYAPQGCLSNTTHPFGAPCQPFLYGNATTGIGSIQVIPASPGVNDAVNGINLERAQVLFPEEHATLNVEQITKVLAKGVTPGASTNLAGSNPDVRGSIGAAPQADTDPGSISSAFTTSALTQVPGSPSCQSTGPGCSGNSNWISATASPAASPVGTDGTATATAAASTGQGCKSLAGTAITNSLPCAVTTVQQAGTSSIAMNVNPNSSNNYTTPLVSVGATPTLVGVQDPTRLSVSRWTTGGGAACAGTSGDGCVAAAAIRRLGRIDLAGLPTQWLVIPPIGWDTTANSFLQLSNYADSVSTETGIAPAAPTSKRFSATTALPGTGSPTIKYWDANKLPVAGYQTITLTSQTGTVNIPQLALTDGIVTVTISGSFTYGSLSTSTTGPVGCATLCSATATAESPLKAATINYKIVRNGGGGTVLADLVISVDLATLTVNSSYQAAPSAG